MADKDKKPLDVGDEGQVRRRKSVAKLAREREVAEVQVLLSTRGGRAFVWRILGWCHVYHSAPADPGLMPRFEGQRDIGVRILNECLTADPNVYILMQQESVDNDDGE
ncbi:hypothetical protein LCGC14_0839230 [marine sediment metagenome]|uniref:Bbp19-like phage domain-containing protein n=1 Tax=marine sediment metagenome TaxID=412755 RepID=A0A0F9PID1_9ZZZZ